MKNSPQFKKPDVRRNAPHMVDPMSFAAGGATVVLGRLVVSSLMSPGGGVLGRMLCPPSPPPPPPPLPRTKVRVRLFVGNMRSILCRSEDDEGGGGSAARSRDGVCHLDVGPSSSTAVHPDFVQGTAVVTLDDILRVKLRPQARGDADRPAAVAVNQGPQCASLAAQRTRLRRLESAGRAAGGEPPKTAV
jgi:hypothetical protein